MQLAVEVACVAAGLRVRAEPLLQEDESVRPVEVASGSHSGHSARSQHGEVPRDEGAASGATGGLVGGQNGKEKAVTSS